MFEQLTDDVIIHIISFLKIRANVFATNKLLHNFRKHFNFKNKIGMKDNIIICKDNTIIDDNVIDFKFLNIISLTLYPSTLITNISHLVNLKYLRLEQNTSITNNQLINMQQLETLILDNTLITSNAFKYLSNLKNLEIRNQSDLHNIVLSLRNNIDYLTISHPFGIVDQKLYHLTNLKKLKIIGSDSDNFDGSCFKYLVNLSKLTINDNKVISDDHLIYNKNLEKLSLIDDRKITGSCFSKLPKLRSLFILNCEKIENQYIEDIAQTLESFTYIYDNSIIISFFISIDPVIQYKLDYCIFKNMNLVQLIIVDADIVNQEAFYQSIQHMTNLKYIECGRVSNKIITHNYIKSILPNVKQICINDKYLVY